MFKVLQQNLALDVEIALLKMTGSGHLIIFLEIQFASSLGEENMLGDNLSKWPNH